MTELAKTEKNEVTFEAGGQEIRLTPSMVQQFITKGGGTITLPEAVNFMKLCQYSGLNPFLNEAYIVKFGNNPAQLITSKEAFLKRASRQADYRGMVSGIVVLTKDGQVNHKKGQLLYPNEKLLGGWAEVYRETYKDSIYVEVSFDEFNKGQVTWKQMPANMINKVAQAKALREAYPDELGAMYIEEEPNMETKDVTPLDKNGDPVTFNHTKPIEENEVPIEEKIKELRKKIKEKYEVKTLKEVDEMVANKKGVETIKDLNDFAILTVLIELDKKEMGNK